MAIKRLSTDELIEKGKEIFFDYMANSPVYYFNGAEIPCTEKEPTPIDLLHKEFLDKLEQNKERLKAFTEELENNKDDVECYKIIEEQIEFLKEEQEILLKSNMKEQKEKYKKTGSTAYSRSAVRIPLDKRINAFYDDLTLEVVFYDDITTVNGKYNDYKKLKPAKRIDFIKDNVEITHLGIALINGNRHIATFGLLGELNYEDPRVKSGSVTLLDSKFSDFNSLTLDDTLTINNNDLRQFLQSKIDLDKENMELLAQKMERGDDYRIYRSPENDRTGAQLYIRYVCPSTGRVYYNVLDTQNLSLSEYFVENDYTSYIDSWWSLTHLGTPIDGAPIIRC